MLHVALSVAFGDFKGNPIPLTLFVPLLGYTIVTKTTTTTATTTTTTPTTTTAAAKTTTTLNKKKKTRARARELTTSEMCVLLVKSSAFYCAPAN